MQCRDHDGDVVDWWMLLKMPHENTFFYLSSKDASEGKTYTLPVSLAYQGCTCANHLLL